MQNVLKLFSLGSKVNSEVKSKAFKSTQFFKINESLKVTLGTKPFLKFGIFKIEKLYLI